ncbi:restriction endonuclease subunit R [cf. Phormidesmis sp. LEGE 11477]|uniref:restriction endonuclease subunit R n=1 Tax=cf. Phormidesmis sp. LEGE 11477 TaxID=1828680 RepID=UPI0018822A63|nr:restriction endonuclease subunit R [cf. Phormidesmis sp. LEGE 11477]MBE9062619.1 restriction endonuclease subunit R [cf. Phormidesmis sp. LEGE 11477]
MIQTVPASKITLYDLEKTFQLEQAEDTSFFEEWQADLPEITDIEQQRLERIQAAVANLEKRSVRENTVKLAVLAPLIDLSGLFLPPFYVSTEESINIEATDGELVIQGRIDILVLKEELWLLVIESKRTTFSPQAGIPQVLSYMLAAPTKDRPVYGLVTNGIDFVFLKLAFDQGPRYGRSRQFVLGQDQDLARVLKIMKHLAYLLSNS